MNCYCGHPIAFEKCCLPKHQNMANARTAEELMRARYSAFVVGNGPFLMASWEPSERQKQNKQELEQWANSVRWLKLEVADCTQGTTHDNRGEVTFTAYYIENGEIATIHETSVFHKINHIWYYYLPKNLIL